MSFRKKFNFSTRIYLNEKKVNTKIVHEINLLWEKDFKSPNLNRLIDNSSEPDYVKFNCGIEKETLIIIKSKSEFHQELNSFKRKLKTEFDRYRKLQKSKLLDDVYNFYKQRLDEDNLQVEKLLKTSNDTQQIKKLFHQSDKTEFNYLLAISQLKEKDKVFDFFLAKGFSYDTINNLEKRGFLIVERDFDNSILVYKMDITLQNRLIRYIEDYGIDINNLEFI